MVLYHTYVGKRCRCFHCDVKLDRSNWRPSDVDRAYICKDCQRRRARFYVRDDSVSPVDTEDCYDVDS